MLTDSDISSLFLNFTVFEQLKVSIQLDVIVNRARFGTVPTALLRSLLLTLPQIITCRLSSIFNRSVPEIIPTDEDISLSSLYAGNSV